MFIGIDGNEANVVHRVGVNRYAFEMLHAFSRLILKNKNDKIKIRVYLTQPPLNDLPLAHDRWEYCVFGSRHFWIEKNLVPRLFLDKVEGKSPSVFWSPNHYAPIPTSIPTIISIMDVSYLLFPSYFRKRDLYQLKFWSWLSILQAKKVFTISHFSKMEITKRYKLASRRVVFIPIGFDQKRFNQEVRMDTHKIVSVTKQYGINGRYILFVGTAQPRKNLIRLIEAFHSISKENPDLHLIVVGMIKAGRGGWMYQEIFKKVTALHLEKNIIFTDYVPDGVLPYLYAGSIGFVLPSLYEGFGIPVLEALGVGTPVIVSKNSSLEEVGGDVALYIENPYNIENITQSIQQLLRLSQSERGRLQEEGFKWVKKFVWDTAGETALQELCSIAHGV